MSAFQILIVPKSLLSCVDIGGKSFQTLRMGKRGHENSTVYWVSWTVVLVILLFVFPQMYSKAVPNVKNPMEKVNNFWPPVSTATTRY